MIWNTHLKYNVSYYAWKLYNVIFAKIKQKSSYVFEPNFYTQSTSKIILYYTHLDYDSVVSQCCL